MVWVKTPFGDSRAVVYFEQPEDWDFTADEVPEGEGPLHARNNVLYRGAPLAAPSEPTEPAEPNVWDEMAAAYQKGVQEA